MPQLFSTEIKSKILIFSLQIFAVSLVLVLIATMIGNFKRSLRQKLSDKRDKKLYNKTIHGQINSKQSKKQRGNPIINIDNMSGVEFEIFLKEMFKTFGFNVEKTPDSGDYGADLYMKKNGKAYVVQAKRHKDNIGLSAVQEVVAAKAHYKAENAIVITNSRLTANAKILAKNNNVIVYERPQLIDLVQKSRMIIQNRKQVSNI